MMSRFLKAGVLACFCIALTACTLIEENTDSGTETTESSDSETMSEQPGTTEAISETEETTEAVSEPEETTETTAEMTSEATEPIGSTEEQTELKVLLSGDPEDSFVAQQDCYAENDTIVMYFQKGITVKGDMLEIADKVMQDLCETTGFDFEQHRSELEKFEFMDDYFEPDVFDGINADGSKINIVVADLELVGVVAWADVNIAVLDQTEFDYEEGHYGTLYHELSHVLQFQNGVSLGSMMDEGFAAYTENKARLDHAIPAWDASQFYFPADFDESLITADDAAFNYYFMDEINTNYQYGFRFVTFLYDTYGETIYADILSEAEKDGFFSGYDADDAENSMKANSQQLLKIIKNVTTETVMADFEQWYQKNWDALGQAYMERVSGMSS